MAISFSSLSGGTSFTIVTSTGGTKTATLDKSYPAGTYLIESKAMDTNLEIYLGASDGTQVGTAAAGAKTVTASASFLYVTTINADANDAIIFTLKSASTLATKTDAVWAPPTITDITPSGLPNANDTTTITGTNFATNVDVKFRKSDDSTLVNAKTTVRGSATSIIATRPDTFAVGDAPYDVIVTNPSTGLAATSLNSITAGAVPVWVTSTTLNAATLDSAFSQTISATDADGGSSITYAIVSGSFHAGLSFNTSTGAITGTPTGSSSTDTITISATDSGGNTVNRTFTHVVSTASLSVDYLVVAGGGGGGSQHGGGGGAGGMLTSSTSFAGNSIYTITVGGGGNGGTSGGNGTSGINSSISGFGVSITATGGGWGAGWTAAGSANYTAGSGGSGGGGSLIATTAATGVNGQGNRGGTNAGGSGSNLNGSSGSWPNGGAGGGGAGSAGQDVTQSLYKGGDGGNGLNNSITGSAITYAGGGGGGAHSPRGGGAAGSGGGGAGAQGSPSHDYPGSAGVNGLGGGGGGGGAQGYSGGAGGSGIVILRAGRAAASTSGSPTYTNPSSGVHIYQFLNNGTITF